MESMKTLAILNKKEYSTNETKFEWTIWLKYFNPFWKWYIENFQNDAPPLI